MTRRICCARASRATPRPRGSWPPRPEHSKDFNAAKTAIGFNATLAKPFRRETLGELLRPRATAEAG